MFWVSIECSIEEPLCLLFAWSQMFSSRSCSSPLAFVSWYLCSTWLCWFLGIFFFSLEIFSHFGMSYNQQRAYWASTVMQDHQHSCPILSPEGFRGHSTLMFINTVLSRGRIIVIPWFNQLHASSSHTGVQAIVSTAYMMFWLKEQFNKLDTFVSYAWLIFVYRLWLIYTCSNAVGGFFFFYSCKLRASFKS